MRYLSLFTATIVIISSVNYGYSTTKTLGEEQNGSIAFVGNVVEPPCDVYIDNIRNVSLGCYHNGKYITKSSSLTQTKILNFSYVEVQYKQFNKKRILSLHYD